MSGFTYTPPSYNSSIYNPLFYPSIDASGFLTYDYAQTLYLSRNDYRLSYLNGITAGQATSGIALVPDGSRNIANLNDVSCASITVGGSPLNISAIAGVTPGTASASKALIVDSNRDITNIRYLTATQLTGTLQTAAQPNITSIGTLSTLTATAITGTLQTAAQPNITSLGTLTAISCSGTISGTLTTAAQPNITSIGTLASLTATSITGTLQTAAQPNITSLGTLTAISCSGNISGTLTTAAQPNITSLGTLTSLTATSITGTLQTASQPNITSLGTLTAISCSGNISGTLTTAAQPNITSLGTLTAISCSGNISGTLTTASQPNITSIGTLTSLTATSITGTLQTAAQPNITSTGNLTLPASLTITNGSTPISVSNTASTSNYQVRIDSVSGNIDLRNNNSSNTTLLSLVANGSRQLTCINNANLVNIPNHNGSTAGLQLGGVLITATASDINAIVGTNAYLSGITPGTVSASKALVVDASKNLTGLGDVKLANYNKFYLNSDLSNNVYLTSSVNNDIIAYSDSISSGCFKFQNPTYGSSPLFASGTMIRMITGHTSFDIACNYNSNWDFKSSGSTYDIKLSPNATTAIQCLASDGTVNLPIALRINKASGSQTALFDAKGSASYLDGSYNRFLRFEGENASPVIFELQVHSGAASTASNAAYFGTVSNNQLRFGTNNSTRMTLNTSGYLGIGTNSPGTFLHVNGSTNISLGTGVDTIYQFDVQSGSSTITNLGTAPVSTAASAFFSSYISTLGIKQVSDYRLKCNIKSMPIEQAKKILNVNSSYYNWKSSPDAIAEIGFIAQDIIDAGCPDLVAFSINEDLVADGKVLKDKVQLNMRYDRVVCYLLELVKDLNRRVLDIEKNKEK
jgi:hypothetical protein